MLVGIDSITDEGVLESLWKPHKSKERNFLHRGYTPKNLPTFFQTFFWDREKKFEKIFSRKISKKNLKFSKSKKFEISTISWKFSTLRISWFCWNFRKFSKITKIFQKKNFEPKKIFFIGVEFFSDDYYMNF